MANRAVKMAKRATKFRRAAEAADKKRSLLQWGLLVLTFLCIMSCPVKAEPEEQSAAPQAVRQDQSQENEYCILSFINIGKGDAFVLTVPQGGHYMIDTGKKSDDEIVGQFLEEKGISHLDGIFLTHGHKDHAGGLKKLLKNGITVDTVYTSAVDTVSYKDFDLEKLKDKYGFTHELLNTQDIVNLGSADSDASLQVLGPLEADMDNENNNSMIMMVSYKDTKFLMMGDAELEEESILAASGAVLSADVLKVGHHGKNDATGSEFLQMVKPSYGIITGSRYEDIESASQKVIARLRAEGIQEYISEGDFLAVDFVSDGTEVTPAEFSKIH